MTTNAEREMAIIKEARELRDFYTQNSMGSTVRLFAEDYDFLKKRGAIDRFGKIGAPDPIEVARGPRKKGPRKRKPKESLI